MVNREEIDLRKVYIETKNTLSDFVKVPDFEAQQIVRQVFDASYSEILTGVKRMACPEQIKRIRDIITRRCEHYPLQYLLGEWDFFGRPFLVGEGVLIPRADTEVLVEEALRFLEPLSAPKVLDLCSGSGCIGLTIALERPDAQVTAVEKSPAAFCYLTQNNERLGAKAECLLGDALALEAVKGPFDLIVSNPPYLTGQDMAELQVEVRFEPAEALYGDEDGLYFYRELTKIYVQRLRPGGMLAYEIGEGQQDAVSELLAVASLKSICQIPDYNGIIRCITGKNCDFVEDYGLSAV